MSAPLKRDVPGIVGSVILIGIALVAIYYSKDFSPLGSVFPRTIGAAMILFSALYIVVAWIRPQPAQPPAQRESTWRRAALAIVMVAWGLLLERVGFLTTSIVAFTALILIANYHDWTPRRIVGYSVTAALVLGGLYALFRFVLQVPLPQGLFL
ncbi:MAG TPA: tripartite tricarboxylate transporter TctB family protein [Usitatibacter sp.]|nr:tripartite tricarboxylate transporter TctB family protein [Usitatibacter sp.]